MGHLKPFWDDEYKHLNYRKEIFNDKYFIEKWQKDGYDNSIEKFSGQMSNFYDRQPKWNDKIIDWATNEMKLKDVGCCYYKMETNDLIPNHSDAYNVYTEKFNCSTEDVHKILIFLEDWRSGHYFELEDKPIVDWKSGDYYQWKGSTKHFAANIGIEPRYTLQITGHK